MIKKIFIVLALLLLGNLTFAQKNKQAYSKLIDQADSLYRLQEFKLSAIKFYEAFKANNGNASQNERYDAASAWALAGYRDSAFFQLNIIATKDTFSEYLLITSDNSFDALHHDKRWDILIAKVRENKDQTMINLNSSLVEQLDSIRFMGNGYSVQLDIITEKFGKDSKEYTDIRKKLNEHDSISLIKVKSMIDKFGWLGTNIVGEDASFIAFMVIINSDDSIGERYLPLMKEAVKKGTAMKSDLALLEDRVLLAQGKRQIYGSQVQRDFETQKYFVLPLEDPDNVDKRRAEVGLEPISKYLFYYEIKWEVEQYKKDLPAIEARIKAQQK